MSAECKGVVKKVTSLLWRDVDKAALELTTLVNPSWRRVGTYSAAWQASSRGPLSASIQALVRRKR